MPRRDTCTKVPFDDAFPVFEVIWTLCRSAVVQTPTIGFFVASPDAAIADVGTWMAIAWTLNPFKESFPTSFRFAP